MPTVEVSLPEDVFTQLERMTEEEFVSREAAVEELLSMGLDAYTRDTGEDVAETDMAEEYADDMFDTAADPGMREEDDDYSF
jgi:metal-responsive CopG/Arc/MetJ family transcriptional regulator